MAESRLQFCPICSRRIPANPRYPRHVCSACAKRACDEEHRTLIFHNESLSGGLVVEYRDTGEERKSQVCFIDGVKCRAEEGHLGGVVIQVVGEAS